jgi:preprotein translocase subunit SecA
MKQYFKENLIMSLLKEWEEICDKERTEEEYDAYWQEYFLKEQNVYKTLLSQKCDVIKGVLSELAKEYKMTNTEFAGFMSGINTSLVTPIDDEKLVEDSKIDVKIDFEKLFYNMHEANASWLYNLSEWDGILSIEKRKEIKAAYNKTKTVVNENKIGRNDPCPCRSGKKYKKCCGK